MGDNSQLTPLRLAWVAQWDVCLTGDQEATGLIPAGSGNVLS